MDRQAALGTSFGQNSDAFTVFLIFRHNCIHKHAMPER
jgi:hypothetical protein